MPEGKYVRWQMVGDDIVSIALRERYHTKGSLPGLIEELTALGERIHPLEDRMREMQDRAIEAGEKLPDVHTTWGANLDWIGRVIRIKRGVGELDGAYRQRLVDGLAELREIQGDSP